MICFDAHAHTVRCDTQTTVKRACVRVLSLMTGRYRRKEIEAKVRKERERKLEIERRVQQSKQNKKLKEAKARVEALGLQISFE